MRERITSLRVGMFLEVATTLGALSGAFLIVLLPVGLHFVIFGLVLLVSTIPLIVRLGEEVTYEVTRVPQGFSLMYLAGLLSGLLGIASGTFKVLAMDSVMRLPMKISTTNNSMIGVTAAASAGIYFERGDINPTVSAPVALGVRLGATLSVLTLARLSNTAIRNLFLPLLGLIAIGMLIRGGAMPLASVHWVLTCGGLNSTKKSASDT